ncbi:unnamed protein product, partial [Symbiodinium necroappetens]
PGDWVYEAEDVSFNLSAAHRCLEETRRASQWEPSALYACHLPTEVPMPSLFRTLGARGPCSARMSLLASRSCNSFSKPVCYYQEPPGSQIPGLDDPLHAVASQLLSRLVSLSMPNLYLGTGPLGPSSGLGGGVYDEIMTHLSASNIDIAVIQESKWSECMEYTSGAWHLHVIAIYQKTHVVSDKNTPVQRQQAWQALHKCLSRVPARDSIVLTGDFNTPLACLPPYVGPFVGAPLSHPPDDVSSLEVLMQTFRLTALNTWYPNPGGVHTFSFGKAKSQIDYIMVRLSEASTSARQVRTMHQFQVGAARKGHRPVPCIDQEALLSALDHPNKADNLQKIAEIRRAVATHVAHHSDLRGVQALHQVLHDACCNVFPASRASTTTRAPPWQQPQVQAGIRNLWYKWRAFKQVRKHGLRGWFQAWRAWKDFDWHYRAHQKRCKQARRAILLQAMHEAEQHAKVHNSRGIYQILKRLAPKQARRRMQLRGAEGQMLEPCAELDLLEQHFSRRFTATQQADVDLASHTWEGQGDLVLDVTTVCRYIQQVPRRKAVPQGHPPSASWRMCADLISPWLCKVVLDAWSTPHLEVPRAWTDVDLALVPKPDKPGKKFLGALLQPYVPGIVEQIKTFPQFAYQQGTKPVPLYGALMITVDLAQLGAATVLRVLTIFADDYHLADSFTSMAELEVSDQKSKAIMVLRGGALNIPLTDCFTYLGARVSYANFERQTLDWRLTKGEAAFQRLGLTPWGTRVLETFVVRQLRAILCYDTCFKPKAIEFLKLLWTPWSVTASILALDPSQCEMNPEQEHRELFGPLVTSQAAAFGTALLDSGGHRPRGGPKGDKQQSLVKAMARLVLRQETNLQVLKQNSAWDVYLQPGPQGPLPMLFRASETYRSEAKSRRMDCPLRAQLLHTLFQTVLTCIQNIKDSAAQTQAAQQRGWLTPEGRWVYQQWDPQAQALIVDGNCPPLENQELLTLLHAMAQAVLRKDVVHRFNATHQLAADPRGTTRFMLEIGLRADGVMDVWKGLEALQGLAALQIVGMQLRRDGLRRSNLAEDIQRMLGEL